jgi:hypothetical protein
MNINQVAIAKQVNNGISHKLTIILQHLRGLHSLMTQAPIDNTKEMQEFGSLVKDLYGLLPVTSSTPSSTLLPRPKTPENSVSMQHQNSSM